MIGATSLGRTFRTALLLAACGLPATTLRGQDDDEVIQEQDADAIDGEIELDQFGDDPVVEHGMPDSALLSESRRDLESYLREKIAAIDFICELTGGQKRKLALAGQGDINRMFGHVAERWHALPRVKRGAPRQAVKEKIAAEISAINDVLKSDPFEAGSLFAKTRSSLLSDAQRGRHQAFFETSRLTGVRMHEAQSPHTDELREVRFPATPFADQDLLRLRGRRTLQRLVLDSTRVTDVGLAQVGELTGLESLDLGSTGVTGASLHRLRDLKALRSLDLRDSPIEGESLEHLKHFHQLQVLNLEGTPIDDGAVRHLAGLAEITALSLSRTRITDAGLVHLRRLRGLRRLQIGDTAITDAGLEHLVVLPTLELLDLRGTRITGAATKPLRRMLTLRHVYVFHTQVTESEASQLEEGMKGLKVFH